ncbi:protein AE7 isoform X1 [Cinnamomum micranthum f. kanehirae]|uniref:Protein AE7 isoform X1 n=1 Tax=Cinnamomum micranthum f. kanehirae TaxID=337451 RepID=A0A3S3NFV6_9MAGN|nr:protein AE7 isoform X1 [Cinnamomum micranthum f. kanehirae]
MVSGLINANPTVYERKERRVRSAPADADEYAVEHIDAQEIFDILCCGSRIPYVFIICFLSMTWVLKTTVHAFLSVISITISNHVRDIKDPEHPYSLEELKVVTEDAIDVDDEQSHVRVTFTPTVEHCSMATVIGLCIRVKLMRSLPSRYKVDIRLAPGSHATEAAVNKQLNDKERIAAALENPNLLDMVDDCLAPTFA